MKKTKSNKFIVLVLTLALIMPLIPTGTVSASVSDVGLQQLLRGYNVLSGKALSNLSTTGTIMKPTAGSALVNHYEFVSDPKTDAFTKSGKSMTDFADARGFDLKISAEAHVDVAKLFKASASTKFGLSTKNAFSEGYESYFYQFIVNRREGRNGIKDFRNPNTIKAIQSELDPVFLNALKNSDNIKRDIFEKYGTHIVTAYDMGGWTEYNLSTVNKNSSTSEAQKNDYGAAIDISGGAGTVSAGVKASTDITTSSEAVQKTGNFESSSSQETSGGKGGINFTQDDTVFTNTINNWLNSFVVSGADANCSMLLDEELRLEGIWELLPDGYEVRKKQIMQEYIWASIAQDMDFYNEFVYKAVKKNTNYSDVTVSEQVGNPPATSAIEIDNVTKFRNIGNAGYPLDGNYVLTTDLDLAGSTNYRLYNETFTGVFDGNGRTISNWKNPAQVNGPVPPYSGTYYYSYGDTQYHGLFPRNEGTIKNLVLKDSTLEFNSPTYLEEGPTTFIEAQKTNFNAGLIAGYNSGTISNCRVENGKIDITYSAKATTNFSAEGNMYGGGIAGYSNGTINRCSVKGSGISVSGSMGNKDENPESEFRVVAGGIVGYADFKNDPPSSISDCYSDITVASDAFTDGPVYTVTRTTPLTDTCAVKAYTGGIAGHSGRPVSIMRCFSNKTLTAKARGTTWHRVNTPPAHWQSVEIQSTRNYSGSISGYTDANNYSPVSDCFYITGQTPFGFAPSPPPSATQVTNFKVQTIVDKLKANGWEYFDANPYPTLPPVKSELGFTVYYPKGKPTFTEGDLLDDLSKYMTIIYGGIKDITKNVQARYNFGEAGDNELQLLYRDGDTALTGSLQIPVIMHPFSKEDLILPAVHSGGSVSIIHSGKPIDLSTVKGLFEVDPNGGAGTYTLETGGTGTGKISADEKTLTVTKTGTFKIGLTTAATSNRLASQKAIATLTVNNTPGKEKGNENEKVKVTGIKTLPKLYLVKGKSVKLPAAVQPYNAANKGVTWKSANKKIATVDPKTGKVKGIKTGKTKITLTTKDGRKIAACKVYVVKKATKLKKLTISNKAKVSLSKGKTQQIKLKLSPAKATGIVPKYKSGKPKVAVVDKAGVITALSKGKTTITVKAGNKTKKITVTVK